MKNKNVSWLLLSLLSLLVACRSQPEFINHPPPNLTVAFDAFEGNSTLAALGCDEIQATHSLVGGLNPAYPIAECVIIPEQVNAETQAEIDKGLYFYYTGGLFGRYIRYVIFQDGEFRLLKSEEEFRAVYAPIETPEEALSYVLAVTNLSASYGIVYDPAYKYEVRTIEDTYITSEPDGYKLHLFHDAVFGCGPHWVSAIEVHVSTDGVIREMSQAPLFRDPNQDDLCID